MPTYKDINLLAAKAAADGTEKIPVSDTEFLTTQQIADLSLGLYSEVFDLSTLIPNVYINQTNGTEVSYSGWSATDFISVENCVLIRADRTMQYSAFYDASQNYIADASLGVNYLPVPYNAAYIRASNTSAIMSSVRLDGLFTSAPGTSMQAEIDDIWDTIGDIETLLAAI